MKKWLAAVSAAVLLLTLSACGKKEEGPDLINAPETVDELATTFIRAYYLKDMLTSHPLYLHDARQRWEDQILKDHKTEEAFCDVVQKQADEKGMSVEIHSFDDYLREFHQRMLVQLEEKHGKYTVSADVTACTQMNEEQLASFCASLSGGTFAEYTTEEQIAKITEGYTLTVDFRIDGEIKDYEQPYTVHAVLCDGQWKVASHSA